MIYIASPYSHPDKAVEADRFYKTRLYVAQCLTHGQKVFSPIVYAHDLAVEYNLPTDALWWERFNFNMMRGAEEFRILRLPGWQTSIGVQAETIAARVLRLHISEVDPI